MCNLEGVLGFTEVHLAQNGCIAILQVSSELLLCWRLWELNRNSSVMLDRHFRCINQGMRVKGKESPCYRYGLIGPS